MSDYIVSQGMGTRITPDRLAQIEAAAETDLLDGKHLLLSGRTRGLLRELCAAVREARGRAEAAEASTEVLKTEAINLAEALDWAACHLEYRYVNTSVEEGLWKVLADAERTREAALECGRANQPWTPEPWLIRNTLEECPPS